MVKIILAYSNYEKYYIININILIFYNIIYIYIYCHILYKFKSFSLLLIMYFYFILDFFKGFKNFLIFWIEKSVKL